MAASHGPGRDSNLDDKRQERLDAWAQHLTRWLSCLVGWVSRHWLALANCAIAAYLLLPALAPVLMYAGHPLAARVLYTVFLPLCHQLPERSFFVFGRQPIYSYQQLSEALGQALVPARFEGNANLGFKVAMCQRDVAIWAAMLLAGLGFSVLRGRVKPLSLRGFGLMALPMAVDGFGQLFRLWTSTWWSRLGTGGAFGLACVWLAYPYLQQGMSEVHKELAHQQPNTLARGGSLQRRDM